MVAVKKEKLDLGPVVVSSVGILVQEVQGQHGK